MVSFSVTFGNVLLMLLYLLPGFLLCRCKKVKPEHLSTASVILLYVCGPGMFLNALIDLDVTPELTARMGLFILFSLVGETALMLLILLLLGRKRKEFGLRMLSIASVMGNVGFFGMPVVRALFPDAPEAAVYSCMFNVSLNIVAWTVGVFTLTGEKKYISLRAALVNPSVLAAAAGFVLYLLKANTWLPDLVRGGFRTLGAMSTPLIWLISAGKLLAFPLFCWALTLPFNLDPVFRGSVLILAATPCASILLNLAEIHHHGQELAANCALLSTLLSIITIPLLSLLT